jgi:hypothetical protein
LGEAMTDEEWEQHRNRAMMEAFTTGRSVFADNTGKLKYYDGAGEDVDPPAQPLPKANIRLSWWKQLLSWLPR